MRLNIDKLMIGFVMILAVCLYTPTLLEDYKANSTTNEKVTEVLAEAPAPAMTTESMVLAAVTTQESIGEAVQAVEVTDVIGKDMAKTVTTDVTKLTPKFQTKMDMTNMIEETSVADKSVLRTMVEAQTNPVYSEFIAHVKTLPVEIKPSLMASDERDKVLTVRDNYDEFLNTVETYYAERGSKKSTQTYVATYTNITGDGTLTASKGVNYGPSGKETYYNLNMSGVVDIMQSMGYNAQYWVREDGVKMYGDYVMVAADLNTHPRGSLVESSLGTAIVVDTGGFAASNPNQLDIATAW
ncbi:hypothetical protein KQI72_04410 [Eubacterium sp. MSJ-21]|nr:hypothetical protein [Eubacterium sp. MSJ-21]